MNIADYIRIRIGHGLTPTKATLLLGMVQQFSTSVISEGIYTRQTANSCHGGGSNKSKVYGGFKSLQMFDW